MGKSLALFCVIAASIASVPEVSLADSNSAISVCEVGEAFKECVKRPEVKEFVRTISVVQTIGLQKADKTEERLVECSNVSLMASGFMEMHSAHFSVGEYVATVATKDAYDYAWKVKSNDVDGRPPRYSDDLMKKYLNDPAKLQSMWSACLAEATQAAKDASGSMGGAK